MKLLFICGAALKDGALRCPSWVSGILSLLSADHTITILSADGPAADPVTVTVGNGSIRLLAASPQNDPDRFARLLTGEKPDAVVIFGTESRYSLASLRQCEAAGLLNRTALFMQGMARPCAVHYADGVPRRIIRRYTFRDILRRENIRAEQKRMEARAEDEENVIAKGHSFIGRTSADRALILSIHPGAAYYRCGDILRDSFYTGEWNYDACEKHRIFISQYYYPIKGFHYLLEAASKLKPKYPDMKLAAAGYNPILKSVCKRELKDSSYIRYLKALIRRFGLADNIELLGQLDAEQMKAEYLRANVFVLPSTIENSPNSLGEAMMLGVPCVAADVGGVSDFADDGQSACIYPAGNVDRLAASLDRLLSDPDEAARIGANARVRAAADYDREANARALRNAFARIAQND